MGTPYFERGTSHEPSVKAVREIYYIVLDLC